jgi:steroid Delta-isomerase
VITSKACANECAFLVKTTNAIPGLPLLEVEALTIYKVNEDGKVVSVRAYWEFDDTTQKAFA